jgi:hypothetical protein
VKAGVSSEGSRKETGCQLSPRERYLTFGGFCRNLFRGGFGLIFAFGGLFSCWEVRDVHS